MSTNVIVLDREARLRNIDHTIQELLDGIGRDIASARQRGIAIGDQLWEARLIWVSDQDFGAWCNQRNWALSINKDYRAALMKLAANRKYVELMLPNLATKAVAPDYLLRQIEEMIRITGGTPLVNTREEVSVITETSHQIDDPPPEPAHPVEISEETPEPTCEKEARDEIDEPSEPSPPATRAPPRQAVSGKNAAMAAWGDIGAQILGCFSDPHARTSWNHLAGKRHGIEVAKFALAYFDRAGIPLPTNAAIKTPNARLVLPWLNSPFADEYDLRKAAGFQKLKDNFDIIERACRPYFETHGHDRSNTCFDLFRREYMRPAELARQAQIEAMRERERKVVNVKDHPAILVYGVELWPDGDLPPNLRLDYDAARWAYFHWSDMEAFFARAEPKVSERGAFWQSRQASLHRLSFPAGAAVSYFWWRAGEAMRKNPDAHMKSLCQPSLNIK